MPVKKFLRRVRRFANILIGRDIAFPVDVQLPREHHGNNYGGWWICPKHVSSRSTVYSFGVGEDISFDLSLIKQYGATVHAFDPTPGSIKWLRTQYLPSELKFHEVGIADFDGKATFYPPRNPKHISHTMLHRLDSDSEPINVEVKRLSTLMKEHGHKHIDILKMDIEGAEYSVLQDIIGSRIPIGQILVEFHHRFPGVGVGKTREAMRLLKSVGYQVFAVAESGEEYSLAASGRV